MKRFLLSLLILASANSASAQFTVPHVFASGTTILASEVNANFDIFAQNALNRTGGTLTGNIAVDANVTIDGVDISDYLLSTGHVRANTLGTADAPAFAPSTDTDTGLFFATGAAKLALDGVERFSLDASGLTIYGTNILNASGKIPALTSTYFVSLDGSAITDIPEANILDGSLLARVAANETVTGAWTFNPGTITTDIKPISVTPTWNNAGTTFTGLDINVTNTASAAGSKLLDARVGGTSKFSVEPDGKAIVTSFQMAAGATNGYALTSDASGNATWQALPPGTTGVPTGLVAMFETSCPSGWTMRSGAGQPYQNKFVRGGATFDSVGGGSDTHTHTVDPASTATSTDGAHTHNVDPANATSTADGAHTHAPASSSTATASGGSHSHTTNFGSLVTDGPNNSTSVQSGTGAGVGTSGHTHNVTIGTLTSSTDGSHTHTVTWPNTASGGAHTHTLDLASTSSTSAGSHSHSVDIASFTSGSASNVPAYIQVVFCKKD